MIIIAFKGVIRDFLQSSHCATNGLQPVCSSGVGTVCKSRATHRALITCNLCYVPHGTTAQLFSLTESKSRFSFILLAEPLTGEGGQETGVPGENSWR